MSTSQRGGYGASSGTFVPAPLQCTCCKKNPLQVYNGVLVCFVCDLPNEMLEIQP